MDIIQDQIRELQATVKELRERLDALQSGDATFDKIICKAWQLVDKDGKARVGAGTKDNGTAAMAWADKDGTARISIVTREDGIAGVLWLDKDGKGRITATTLPNGDATVCWNDKDEQSRFLAGTRANGTVIYPTRNGK
jgi:hypothetical protein